MAGAVSGLFGVTADDSATQTGWRRERQDNSDSDPISGTDRAKLYDLSKHNIEFALANGIVFI